MSYRSRLCATVTAPTTAELRTRRDAVRGADLVELRLDTVADPDVAGALAGRAVPVVLTCRSRAEGGSFAGSEDERHRILRTAAASDAEYVDVEWAAGFGDVLTLRGGRGVVLSHHVFSGVPVDLEERAAAMARAGAEIVKMAVAVDRHALCARLLDVSRAFAPGRSIVIGMGEAGLVTRVLAARFGSAWSYAGDGVAPGQLSVAHMAREFGFARMTASTRLYGLVGRSLGYSVSPAMHNAGFAELGEDAVYLPLPVAELSDIWSFADTFEIAGLSVTIPFKAEALRAACEATALAREAASANTLVRVGDRYYADNTDLEGFLGPLAGYPLEGARVAILGHGGAARTAALGLKARGARVTLYGRDTTRAVADAAVVGVAGAGRPVPAGTWDLLVNATPVGTYPACAESSCPEAVFTPGSLVYDLVYNPPETALIEAARLAGCTTIGGLDMLVHQARLQQARWIRRMPSTSVLRDAARWKLSTCAGGV